MRSRARKPPVALKWAILPVCLLLAVPFAATFESATAPAPPSQPGNLHSSVPDSPPERIFTASSKGAVLLLPDGQREPIRSLLNVPGRMRFGDFVWNDANVPAGPVWIRVDLGSQLISVFRAGHEIGSAVILYGDPSKPTPLGAFRVLEKQQDHYSRSYDAPMPYMLRLTNDGVAIHASAVRQGAATHGCIGVPMAFARKLFAAARPGDRVFILTGKTLPKA